MVRSAKGGGDKFATNRRDKKETHLHNTPRSHDGQLDVFAARLYNLAKETVTQFGT